MEKKIDVVICTGTHCFVMGGSDLMLLEDHIPDELKDKVEIRGSSCLGNCEDRSGGKAPFVEINGELLQRATIPAILRKLHEITANS